MSGAILLYLSHDPYQDWQCNCKRNCKAVTLDNCTTYRRHNCHLKAYQPKWFVVGNYIAVMHLPSPKLIIINYQFLYSKILYGNLIPNNIYYNQNPPPTPLIV